MRPVAYAVIGANANIQGVTQVNLVIIITLQGSFFLEWISRKISLFNDAIKACDRPLCVKSELI